MYLIDEDRARHAAALADSGPIDGASATYCPEDDKLRLYVGYVSRPVYDALRAHGWTATPKQDCDFAAVWTVYREDMALALLPEGLDIEDEDTPPEERAADRAERFGGYRDKRLGEAIGHADAFDEGPQAIGCQSAARAERIARRHDRTRGRAVTQWSKAEYWTRRTAGVIGHALYKSSAHVRRGRIAKLESDLRKIEAGIEEAQTRIDAWRKVAGWALVEGTAEQAHRWAVKLANIGYGSRDYTHPRTGETGPLWRLLDSELTPDPLTAAEAAALWLENRADPAAGGYGRHRDHLRNRIAYERQMLAAQGGSAKEVEIEPGGYIHAGRSWYQGRAIHHDADGRIRVEKVNKGRDGLVSSVGVLCVDRWGNGDAKQFVSVMKVERLGEDAYRPPTDEERARFAAEKKRKPKAPPLINPTDEDAQRLQDLANAAAALAKYPGKPAEVKRMTQAEYSRFSGEDRPYNVWSVTTAAPLSWRNWTKNGAQVLARVRAAQGAICTSNAPAVIVLTDKPQKPLPAAVFERAAQPPTVKQSLTAQEVA
ncbi:DUF3560 domain-containing protein [Botrimarina mediterranea]|uniref:DUF3560 domain-containing protein n=1 Tax=Botrimarina mediterranea TaxID=2528022 RepID=A0A518KC98_9BACT|nr:DUF3560 domain-containing protein [Botrimarina mediterranea]QDV75405.1 hypothetical protein Spa11_36220 [Botrimarina mediterranea]